MIGIDFDDQKVDKKRAYVEFDRAAKSIVFRRMKKYKEESNVVMLAAQANVSQGKKAKVSKSVLQMFQRGFRTEDVERETLQNFLIKHLAATLIQNLFRW